MLTIPPIQQLQTQLNLSLPSPIQRIRPFHANTSGSGNTEDSDAHKVTVYLKRDDLIHPIISGNKWRKLKYTLANLPTSSKGVLSFGGGHSNHLHALSYVCAQLRLPFVAIVRGHYEKHATPTLQALKHWGTQIHYVDKVTYRQREEVDYLNALQKQYPDYHMIPEGGSQTHALLGMQELMREQRNDFDYVMAPVASGATLAGIIQALQPHQHAIGVAVLKGEQYVTEQVSRFLAQEENQAANWHIEHDFHCGGYAKRNSELDSLCEQINAARRFAVEPIYSGKVFLALRGLLDKSYFPAGSKILIIHTGGLGTDSRHLI